MAESIRTDRASLGCGTLLLIVMGGLFFFRPGITELEREVRNLRSEVSELKSAIDAQSAEIRMLQSQNGKSNGKETASPGLSGSR